MKPMLALTTLILATVSTIWAQPKPAITEDFISYGGHQTFLNIPSGSKGPTFATLYNIKDFYNGTYLVHYKINFQSPYRLTNPGGGEIYLPFNDVPLKIVYNSYNKLNQIQVTLMQVAPVAGLKNLFVSVFFEDKIVKELLLTWTEVEGTTQTNRSESFFPR